MDLVFLTFAKPEYLKVNKYIILRTFQHRYLSAFLPTSEIFPTTELYPGKSHHPISLIHAHYKQLISSVNK